MKHLQNPTTWKWTYFVGLLIIFGFSSWPNAVNPMDPEGKGGGIPLDKVIHFSEFFALTFAFICWRGSKYSSGFTLILLAFLSSSLIAVLDESYQLLIPGRSFNPVDILFDIGGASAAILFFFLTGFRWPFPILKSQKEN